MAPVSSPTQSPYSLPLSITPFFDFGLTVREECDRESVFVCVLELSPGVAVLSLIKKRPNLASPAPNKNTNILHMTKKLWRAS